MVTAYIMVVVLIGIIIISVDRMNDDSLEGKINAFLKSDKRIKRCN